MLKHFFVVASFLTVSITAKAQNCDALKLENGRLKFEIAKLQNEAAGKKLDAMLTQTQSGNDIDFTLLSATGDKKNQTVTVVMKFTNKAANKEGFTTMIKSFSNPEGEEFAIQSSMIGKTVGFKTLPTDAPMQGIYVFGGVLPKVTVIRMLAVPYQLLKGGYETYRVEFRDIPINWK